jgi:predicted RND superfamily exporter protein
MLQETSQEVLYTYLLALVVVFLVLCAQFESFNSALVVVLLVPFGLAASAYALFLTGTSINIYSQIGLILLIGLTAKNSILLVEFADQMRDQGCSVREAIERSTAVRLRPVVMTMMSTTLGGLPLILSGGAGAEARHAIGWVIFGGLGLAALFALFLTPVIYFGLARFSKPRAAGGGVGRRRGCWPKLLRDCLNATQQPGQKHRIGEGGQCHTQAGERPHFGAHLKGPRGADPVGRDAHGNAFDAFILDAHDFEQPRAHHCA